MICFECKRRVSDDARVCEYCGSDTKTAREYRKALIRGSLIGGGVGMAISLFAEFILKSGPIVRMINSLGILAGIMVGMKYVRWSFIRRRKEG